MYFWQANRACKHIAYAMLKHGVLDLEHLLMTIGGGPPKRGRPTAVKDPRCMYSGVCQKGKKAKRWVSKR